MELLSCALHGPRHARHQADAVRYLIEVDTHGQQGAPR
jgi:hypothetical protein